MLSGVSMDAQNGSATFCNIYTRDGIALSNTVLGGLAVEDNLIDAMRQAKYDAGYSYDQLVKDFSEGNGGEVCFTYNGIQETLSYVPVDGTDWLLTYLIRENVISDSISTISNGIILRSIIQSLLTVAILLLLFSFIIHQTRKNAKLILDKETTDAKNKVKQEELEHRLRLQDELLAQKEQQEEQTRMITALASDYWSVYYLDLDRDEGVCYQSHSDLDNGFRVGDHFRYISAVTAYANENVKEQYREAFLDFIQPENVKARLQEQRVIAYRYLVHRHGGDTWEEVRFASVLQSNEKEDRLVHLVGACFVDVDQETRKTIAQNQALHSFEEKNSMNIVMEYCDGGDLDDFIKENKKKSSLLDENLIWKIFIKITIGLADIHKLNILHRDLKTLNIFLKKGLDMDIKIGDLGVAKMISNNAFAKTLIGTPYYLSPEICEDKPYNNKSDVWALGCILYELCTFKRPFEAGSQGALVLKILNNDPEPINQRYSKDLQNLIPLLLNKNSEKRLSCLEILKTNMVIDKAKKLGLYKYIQKLDKTENKYTRTNNNNNGSVKMNRKITDINITKRNYSKNKDNAHKTDTNGKSITKNMNSKRQVSAIDITDEIKNKKSKFYNINKQIKPRRITNDVKINVITTDNLKNQKSSSNVTSNNKNNVSRNFKINNTNFNSYNSSRNTKSEKYIISEKVNRELSQNKSTESNKRTKNHHGMKIIKNLKECPTKKLNNIFERKKMVIINNRNNSKDNSKIRDNDSKSKYSIRDKKTIYNRALPTNQTNVKYLQFNNSSRNTNSTLSTNKKDIIPNTNNNKRVFFRREYKVVQNNNRSKNNLIELLPKNNQYNNYRNNNNMNKSFSSFKIINNSTQDNKNNKTLMTNDFEDSINKKFKNNHKISLSKNKKNNDNEEEKLEVIPEYSLTDRDKKTIDKNKNTADKGIKLLKDKIQKYKDDFRNLLGEKDFNYVMNQFNKIIYGKNTKDEICEKIEDYANKNFPEEKKSNFFEKYSYMINNDSKLGEKLGN